MSDPIRVGLIGLGRAGTGMHRSELLPRQDKFQFYAVCDLIPERCQAFHDEFGSKMYSKIEDILADPDVELIDIATRSCDHFKHAKMALLAGKALGPVYSALAQADLTIALPGSVTALADPRTLVIQPWDGTLLKAIEKALLISELGINPQNDGKVIRLVFPQLTEERRKELTKQVKKYGEGGKVAIRNIRRDAMEKFKAMKKKSEITEDDLKECEETMQKMTDKRCKEIDELTAKKEAELMAV